MVHVGDFPCEKHCVQMISTLNSTTVSGSPGGFEIDMVTTVFLTQKQKFYRQTVRSGLQAVIILLP